MTAPHPGARGNEEVVIVERLPDHDAYHDYKVHHVRIGALRITQGGKEWCEEYAAKLRSAIAAAISSAEARGERRGIELERARCDAVMRKFHGVNSTIEYGRAWYEIVEPDDPDNAVHQDISLPPAREAAEIESEIRATAYGVAGQTRVLTDAREAAACGTCYGRGTIRVTRDPLSDNHLATDAMKCPACQQPGGNK